MLFKLRQDEHFDGYEPAPCHHEILCNVCKTTMHSIKKGDIVEINYSDGGEIWRGIVERVDKRNKQVYYRLF